MDRLFLHFVYLLESLGLICKPFEVSQWQRLISLCLSSRSSPLCIFFQHITTMTEVDAASIVAVAGSVCDDPKCLEE